jgi:hypothetical protein
MAARHFDVNGPGGSKYFQRLDGRRISAKIFTGNGSRHGADKRLHAATSERTGSLRFLRADNDEREGANVAHDCQSFTTLCCLLFLGLTESNFHEDADVG